jgi:hypothetical protein
MAYYAKEKDILKKRIFLRSFLTSVSIMSSSLFTQPMGRLYRILSNFDNIMIFSVGVLFAHACLYS